MYRSDLTDADSAAAALWYLFEGMTGSSNTSAPQGVQVHEDPIAAYPSISDLNNFDIGDDTAFTPASTTPTGTFTAQSNYSHPVSTTN